jgi:hypothetical protein
MRATPSQMKRLTELLMIYPICYQPEGQRTLVFCDPQNKSTGRILGPTGKTRPIWFYEGTMDVERIP